MAEVNLSSGDAEGKLKFNTLYQHIHNGEITTVRSFLQENASLADKTLSGGRAAIHWAASGGHLQIVQMLVDEYSVDPDTKDEMNWTALMIATSAGHEDLVNYLLTCKVDINWSNLTGQCSLHYSASKDRLQISETLIKSGAEVSIRDNHGNTPLHRAASMGHTKIMKLLLDNGARPNTVNNEGNTPLYAACEEDREAAVSLLLSHRADPSVKNKEEKTAFDVASDTVKKLLNIHTQSSTLS